MSIPNPQTIPFPIVPPATINSISVFVRVFLLCKKVHLYHFILHSPYKVCHTIFLLYLTHFSLYDNLWVHPCCCKWHYFILFHGWEIFHHKYVPYLLYPFLCPTSSLTLPHSLDCDSHFLSENNTLSMCLPADTVPGPCWYQRECMCSSVFPTLMQSLVTIITCRYIL